jgi:hypothetical protein
MPAADVPGTAIPGIGISGAGVSVTAVRPVRCPVSISQISKTDFNLSQTGTMIGNRDGEVTDVGVQVAVGVAIMSRRPSSENAADVNLILSRSHMFARFRGSQFHFLEGVSNNIVPSSILKTANCVLKLNGPS